MARPTMKLSAQDRVILFCAATGIDHAAVGITARAMQAVTIRGFIAHNRESGASDVALKMAGRSTPSTSRVLLEKFNRLHRNKDGGGGAG
jgi:hypothetical protein